MIFCLNLTYLLTIDIYPLLSSVITCSFVLGCCDIAQYTLEKCYSRNHNKHIIHPFMFITVHKRDMKTAS